MKNILADKPKPATIYEIILYYKGGSYINLKIIRPIPKTKKFEINVNVFLKLLR